MKIQSKICPSIFDPQKITAYFYGRNCGFSSGVYAELNCSKYVGDSCESVEQNLNFVRNDVQAQRIITLKQEHGILCVHVDNSTQEDIDINADASVTKSYGVALGILTADCAPVLLADEKNAIVAAAHAGWRGAIRGVLEAAIEKMCVLGADLNNIKVAIGPAIQQKSCEIKDDFINEFVEISKYDVHKFVCEIGSKKYFDLSLYCSYVLLNSGINIDNVQCVEENSEKIDTYKLPNKYFSYRYAKDNKKGICGRQISVICLKSTRSVE